MYQSLLKHCSNFHLYVYAFDDSCFEYLNSHNFEHLTVIPLKDFENNDLLRIKSQRTAGEYCWTCSSSTIHYSITKYNLNHCTYVDADLLFYSDPHVLIDEMRDNSVLITSHRYSQEYDQSSVSGKYCVQFITFKNSKEGMLVLNWWKNACIEWCYARVEDGKFGDQKYVDEFQSRFSGLCELNHLGGGIAPWNVQQYSFDSINGKISGTEIKTNRKFEVVFFHFHGLKYYEKNIVGLTGELYEINKSVRSIFYFPYISLLNNAKKTISEKIQNLDTNGNAGIAPYKPLNLFLLIRFYLSGVKHNMKNIFGQQLKSRIAHHHFFYNK